MSTTNIVPVPEGRLVAALGFKALRPQVGAYAGPGGEHLPVVLTDKGIALKLQPGDPFEIVKASDVHRFDLPTWRLMARGRQENERIQALRDTLRAEVEAELRDNLVISGKRRDQGLSAKHVRPRLSVLADLVADGTARFLGSEAVLKAAGRGREPWPTSWPSWAVSWALSARRSGFIPAQRNAPDLVVACSHELRDGVYPQIGWAGKNRTPAVVVREQHAEPRPVTLVTGVWESVGAFVPETWISDARRRDAVANAPEPVDPVEAMLERLRRELAVLPESDADTAALEILARRNCARRVEDAYVLAPR